MKRVIPLLLTVGVIAGCSKESSNSSNDTTVDQEVIFGSTKIESRVENDLWSEDDKVGIFMFESEYGTATVSNVKYTTGSDSGSTVKFTADDTENTIYYPQSGSVDFLAYYPYQESMATSTIYSIDVSSQSSAALIDLLVSDKIENQTSSSTQQSFSFSHKLARVIFELNVDQDDNISLDGAKATLSGSYTTAQYDINATTPQFTSLDDKSDIEMVISSSEASAIIIPQTLSDAEIIVTTANGEVFKASFSKDVLSGNEYTYSVNIAYSDVTLDGNSIIGWGDGGNKEDLDTSTNSGTSSGDNSDSDTDSGNDGDEDEVGSDSSQTSTAGSSADDPILITTISALTTLASEVNGGDSKSGVFYKLSNNIDLEGSSVNKWTPIGDSSNAFNGTFDGNNQTLSNLYVDTPSGGYGGLFGSIGSSGTVKSLTVSGSIADSSASTNCGGIAGINKGEVSSCESYVEIIITGSPTVVRIGGLVGDNNGGTVSSCNNRGNITVTASGSVGGICGRTTNGMITNCTNYATLTVTSNYETYVGGIVGGNSTSSSTITGCTNSGSHSVSSNCTWANLYYY